MLYDRTRLGVNGSDLQRSSSYLHNDRIHKQSQLVADACSQSVVSTMERFVNAVNEMNENVILPTKLLDEEECPRANIPLLLRGGNSTRYDFYHCLNIIKKDLVLGLGCDDDDDEVDDLTRTPDVGTTSTVKMLKSLMRRHSTTCAPKPQPSENLPKRKISLNTPADLNRPETSPTALNSFQRQDSWASLSSVPEQHQQPSRKNSNVSTIPEHHTNASCDSGGECEEDGGDVMSPVEIAEHLREHLQELQIGLHRLTNTAKYITNSIE